jgi:acyl-CoA thioesterase
MSGGVELARLCSGTLGLQGEPDGIRSVHIEPVHCVGPKKHRFLYGGVGTALCIETLQAALGKEVRNISVQFVRPTPVGSDLQLEVVRHSGRALAQAAIECRIGDRLMMAALASLGSVPEGIATAGPPPPPAVPPPLDCPVIIPHFDAHEDAHSRMELRHIQGRFGMFSRHEQSPDGHVLVWMRAVAEPLHVTHLAMVADFVPSVTSDALGHRAGGSSLDNVFRYLGPIETEWVLADLSIRRISRGVAHSTVDIWDESGRLIAMGGQSYVARSMLPPAKDG